MNASSDIERVYPLLPMQRGMVFSTVAAGDGAAYVCQTVATLDGAIDRAAFERAWRGVISRHDALRTSVEWEGLDEPLQRVHREVPFQVVEHDWAGLDEATRQARIEAWLADDRQRPFALDTPPLMRFALLRCSAERSVFVWTHHHVLLDGRSRVLVLKEVEAGYEACRRGADVDLPAVRPFADYVAWFRAQDVSAAQTYWTGVLQGVTSPTLVARTFAADGSAAGEPFETHEVPLSAALKAALRRVARRHGATPNLVVQAAWAILIGRYGSTDDVLFGETRACRRSAFEQAGAVVGLLMNTVPIRMRLAPSCTAAELLDELRAQHLALRDHETTPLADIRTWIGDVAATDLFDTIVVFEEAPLDAAIGHDATLWQHGVHRSSTSHYPVTLVGYNKPELALSLSVDRRVVSRGAAERLCGHLTTLLEAIAADPAARVRDLPMLTAAERARVLVEWNAASTPYPARPCVHQVFAGQAQQTPDAIAVVMEDACLSYRALDERANQLANYLRRRGVDAEVRVASCLERSLDALIAILAILKAGGAYVPLEPSFPRERLSFLLHDSGAHLVLAHTAGRILLPADSTVIALDAVTGEIDRESCEPPADSAESDRLAYVMYTSGSTGTPKGVAVPHRGVLRLLFGVDYVDLGPGNTILQLAPLGFDASTFEIWGALLHGGRLVLYPGSTPSLDALGEVLRREHVTCLWLTASLFNLVVDGAPDTLRGVRQILTGGEALSLAHVRRAQASLPDAQIVNGYGPTEGTTFTCCYRIPRDLPATATSIPIGRPIANTPVFVLDAHGVPAPVGVPGELFVSGAGLARAYLDRPDLTAASFRPNPFAPQGGDRLYATGDWVRWQDDGTIEFLGRRDDQVKIRGFRIELGEIEAALRTDPRVQDAVVVARAYPEGTRLVAYVAAEEPWQRDAVAFAAALRQQAAETQPEYMVPWAIVVLDALPLTASGKVDRQGLPDPAIAEAADTGIDRADVPRTELEAALAASLGEVLGQTALGLDDDFFARGGHSLLAMRAASRVRTRVGMDVPMRLLFEAPTVRQLAARLDEARRAAQPPVPAVSRTAPLHVSFAQERLLFLEALDGGAQYNVPVVLRLHGALDVAALQTAWQQIVARHEALRTTFAVGESGATLQIAPAAESALPVIALEHASAEERAAEAARVVDAQARAPFDLQREVWRGSLLRLAADEHVLALTLHHAVCDQWTHEVLAEELATLYAAAVAGQSATLAPLAVQYADYAAWQRAWMSSPEAAAQLAYWRDALRDVPRLALPGRRPATVSPAGAQQTFVVPAAVIADVTALSRREGVTVFMTLLAAWQMLLARYTSQTDIVVGTPISGRTRAELEGVVGLFLNTLALRTDLDGNPSFREALGRVRDVAVAGYAHQDVPFEQVVEAVQPTRDGRQSPLVDVLFVVQSVARAAWALPGVAVTPESVDTGTAKFDLTLTLRETTGDWRGVLNYRTARFEAAPMAALVGHWQRLLAAAAAGPDRRLHDLPLLDDQERLALLAPAGRVRRALDGRSLLHELFERQVHLVPDRTAMVDGDGAVSYRALDARANRLARQLHREGVRPGTLVGVCSPPTADAATAILAILKAGAAYVPIDPAAPADRVRLIAADTSLRVLVADGAAVARLAGLPIACCTLDDLDERSRALDGSKLPVEIDPASAAYVIYTSGSTGRPKGVVMPHRALANLMAWQIAETGGPLRTLQHTTLSFDVSCQEIFATWGAGGTLVVEPAATRDPIALLAAIDRAAIERLFVPFVLLQRLAESARTPHATLQQIITAGEQLQRTPELTRWFSTGLPNARLINQYGPSEAHVVTAFDLPRDPETWLPLPPLGYAIANVDAYVLDLWRQIVPVGVVGEIYLGGVALAHGYHRRPGLTADRFEPDAISGRAGARLYRTGDLGRYRADGTIEFLGRVDFQEKIRGFRVELGEIEAALRRDARVRDAVVVARPYAGDKRLVAYVTTEPPMLEQSAAFAAELRRHAAETLPEYMVPWTIVVLESWPLTTSGKVDRQQLPAPTVDAADEEADRADAPRTALEAALAASLGEVLGRTALGLDENFFAQGGHSLLAMSAASRMRTRLDLDVPVGLLFEAPTVRQLAARLDGARRATAPPVPTVNRTDALRVSFAQERLLFLQALDGDSQYNVPVVLRLHGALDVAALQTAWQQIVARHEVMRTTFVLREGVATQQIAPPNPASVLPVIALEGWPADARTTEVARLVTAQARTPFDLQREVWRGVLLRLASDEYVLALTLHHAVCDQWSHEVLAEELATLYAAAARDRVPARALLAPLPVQYADYAAWQRAWMNGPEAAAQLAYWRDALRDAPRLALPGRRATTASPAGAQQAFVVPAAVMTAVSALSRREGVTVFMTLLAAWQVLLARYTGQTDIVVGTPISGRTRAELEGVVGLFLNTLALRTDLRGNPSFRQVLGRVRDVAVGGYAHQDVPFEQVVEAVQPERDGRRSPLVDVLLVVLSASRAKWTLPGVTVTPQRVDTGAAKFDLRLMLQETAGDWPGLLTYRTARFEAAPMAALVGHWQQLLAAAVAEPEQRIGALPLLTPAERAQLGAWNATARPLEAPLDLSQRVAAHAAARPDQTAVVCGDAALSYAALDGRVNQLARVLRARGVGAETRVALALERSVDLVVAVLGVLKAGGAYVPLDLGWPASRIATVLRDAGAALVLTQSTLQEEVPLTSVPAVCLDTLAAALAEQPATGLPSFSHPQQAAYVLYTSGSTGEPKGVVNTHVGLVNRLLASQDRHPLDPADRVLHKAPLIFDISLWELCWPLVAGSTLVVAKPDGHRDPAYLIEEIGRQQVTVAHFVPSMLRVLLEQPRVEQCTSLVRVFAGGEALTPDLEAAFYARLTASLHNQYGPTEAAIDVTAWDCPRDGSGPTVPIGTPLANTQLYVLSAEGEPVPVGVSGELYLAGLGLARGYVGRPDATAERFLPNPFSDTPGARMYRVGDVGRYRADGAIEFLGRVDFQVKLRGMRIELGEIEATLRADPRVTDAVVVARPYPEGERLVAYVAAAPAADESDRERLTTALRRQVAETLPEAMVPWAIVVLEVLPLTASGKVDRQQLPAPAVADATDSADGTVEAPRTALEAALAASLGEVLGRAALGLDENFFAQGGHSLAAMRAASRARTRVGLDVPVRAVFEAPTVRQLAAWLERARRAAQPPVPVVSRADALRVSFAQERMLFLQTLDGGPQYNVPVALRLRGALDVAALQSAWQQIVARHEVLRTTVAIVDGVATLQIAPPVADALPVIALEHARAEERTAEAARLVAAQVRTPFDLQREMWRGVLLRLDPEEHVLALTLHHAVCDQWSLELLATELATLYAAAVANDPASLIPLPLEYADYAAWQRTWMTGAEASAQLAYWRGALRDVPRLALPARRSAAAVGPAGAQQPFVIPAAVMAAVNALSRREGVTVFMTLLAAWQVLLARYTGQTDIVVGTPISGRTRAELEGVVGLFLNTLALRTDLSGNPSFRQVLDRVRTVAVGAYAHQDVPFEQVVEAVQPLRDGSRLPLVDVLLVVQPAARADWRLPGVTVTREAVDTGTAKFDLTLTLRETAGDWRAVLTYRTARFEAAQIAALAEHWQQLLAAAVIDPERPIGALPLLTPAEYAQQLSAWNATARPLVGPLDLARRVAAQAAERPDQIAVVCGDAAVSYAALDGRAHRLARVLRARGIGAEMRVAIALERSLDLVVAVLGVLEAGAAYLPVDPGLPAKRIAYLLSDAEAALVLTHTSLQAALPLTEAPVLCVDALVETLVARPDSDQPSSIDPHQAAYVIYTSGSTGQPKGVVNTQLGIVNRVLALQETYPLEPTDRVLHKTPIGFDVSVWELFWPLVAGSTLVVARPDGHRDPAYLVDEIGRQQVTVAHFVPSMLRAFLEHPQVERCTALVRVFASGEALTPDLEAAFFARLGASLHNQYGPTEAAIEVTAWDCPREGSGPTVPIGTPIANTQMYVLSAEYELVPVGVSGELYIAGFGLARGYAGRPDATAERFLPNPFSDTPGARMYRVGDLGRYRADGTIEFLGRVDYQEKIRGFRVELGEIEAALRSDARVRDAVVIARPYPEGKRLVAYIAADEQLRHDSAALAAAVRQQLVETLPEYMVPWAIVVLAALPLTTSGKVDRQQLPAPVVVEPEEGGADAGDAPQTELEAALAASLGEVLGRAALGVDEDFFAQGGHSLLAMRVVSLLRTRLALEVPVRWLFEAPTARQLAARLEGARRSAQPAVPAVSRTDALRVSFAQERLLFLQALNGGAQYNVPIAVRLRGPLDVAVLQAAWQQIVARHEVLRTTFAIVNGVATPQIAPAAACALPVIVMEQASAEERAAEAARLVTAQARTPFDLQREVWRAALLRLEPEEHVLALTLHHVVCDQWSLEVLANELTTLYAAGAAGHPAPLMPLPVQYADYAAWQRAWMTGAEAAAQLAYWRGALSDAPPLALPAQRSSGTTSSVGAQQAFVVPAAVMTAVNALSRREGVTVFMTLLAAWQVLLARSTGQTDIVVGTPISGRTRAELEGVVGVFLNTLALRTDLSGNPSFREVLDRVRTVAVGGYAHQDVPFDQVVEAVQPIRDGSRSPLVEVLLVVQPAGGVEWALPGVTATPEAVDTGTAKFDLTLALRETAGDWRGVLSYRTARFDAAQMAALASRWRQLLAAAVADPEQRIGALPLLTPAEHAQQLSAWNATARPFDASLDLSQLVAAQAAARPDQTAVVSGDAVLTYATLDGRANQLARVLRVRGVGPETRVAIALERSVDVVVAVLGVLKAGGAYVPLDPGWPAKRLGYVLRDAGAALVLTQSTLHAELPLTSAPVVCLDTLADALAAQPVTGLPIAIDSQHAAYVIYTSGSTGQPKGVVVSHQSVVNFLTSMAGAPGLTSDDVVLAVTTLAFDIAGLELFLPLVCGATIAIARDGAVRDARELMQVMSTSGATLLQATPTTWTMLLQAGWAGDPQLTALIGGEAFSRDLVDRLAPRVKSLWNMYGPTETTIWSCIRELVADGAIVPIGSPIANTTVYVLDRYGQLLPPGVIGELYIGGQGVARGYWQRPDLTAARFVPDPFSAEVGARLYRTGDLVRWLADGTLEFVARVDRQVKIRGYRIELGEIEAVIAQHPDVTASAVVVADAAGDPRLVAYYVADGVASLDRTLKEHARERLPGYMTPTVFVRLPAMPLTANGKLDRRALPEPDLDAALEDSLADHVAPRTPVEEMLAAICAAVLRVRQVSMQDNFFDLGGHSMTGMQIIARVSDALETEVSLRVLFETPTLAACAAAIVADEPDGDVEQRAAIFNATLHVADERGRQRTGDLLSHTAT